MSDPALAAEINLVVGNLPKKHAARARVGVMVTIGFVLIVTAFSIVTFIRIDHELDRSRTADSDNRTWVIAQIEFDIQRMQIALLEAQRLPDAAALGSVRLAFDILYSRVDLVRKAPTLDDLAIRHTDTWDRLAGPSGIIADFAPLIDSPDATLQEALPGMVARAMAISLPVREIVVEAISQTMQLGDQAREQLQKSLYFFMITLVVTMLTLTILLTTIYRQSRAQQHHAKMMELAVHNLRATIESSPDAVLIINANDRVIGANKAGETMIGRTVGPSAPVAVSDLLEPGTDRMQSGHQRTRMSCRRQDRGVIPVEVTIAQAETATGYRFKIAFLRDMTEQICREGELAAATEKARRGEETKDRFLAVMSHEMRTPLSGLLSATELLETVPGLDDQHRSLVNIVRACGQSALEQVNNVLELTRLSAREASDYPPGEVSVVEVIEQHIRIYQVLADQRGNTIRFTAGPDSDCRILAPLPLVRRIVSNLLSNAIKFTRDGTIDVQLAVQGAAGPGVCRFVLTIRDTGIGIAETDLDRVFHNFQTLEGSSSSSEEGTGLGLGIARLAAEAMGGTIRADSRLGEGTCFTVTFDAERLHPPPETARSAPPPVQHAALRILLAEDNEINRVLMERQLTGIGHVVTAVADGAQAVEMAARMRFDVILMDISMPVMDGVAATRQLRDRGLLAKTPVIALTAQAAPNRMQMLRDAGMAEVVIKPVPVVQLDRLMRQLSADHAGETPDDIPGGPPAGQAAAWLDPAQLDDLIDGLGKDMLMTMVDRFEHDMQATLAGLSQALSCGDCGASAALAHRAAGAAGVLALRPLTAELLGLERAALATVPEDLAGRIGRIAKAHAASLAAIRRHIAAA